MARKDRTGNRKPREQRAPMKIPELGYYLVVTDTEATERCYFQGLHQELPKEVQKKLVIKVVETKTRAMIDKCLAMTAYDAQYRIPWIVFDRDEVKDFDEIIREAESFGIRVGWSKIFRTGDEEKALQIARQKHEQCVRDGKTIPSQMCPCTTVYQLVEEIKNKVYLAGKVPPHNSQW